MIMAGRGVAPKPAERRARQNKDSVATTELRLVRAAQPELPDDVDWHPRTRAWWAVWQRSALAKDFTELDWEFLLETALLHTAYWAKGHWTVAAELRLRVAKYGMTPEDRARLRIVFADADEKDGKRNDPPGSGTRARRGPLKAV